MRERRVVFQVVQQKHGKRRHKKRGKIERFLLDPFAEGKAVAGAGSPHLAVALLVRGPDPSLLGIT